MSSLSGHTHRVFQVTRIESLMSSFVIYCFMSSLLHTLHPIYSFRYLIFTYYNLEKVWQFSYTITKLRLEIQKKGPRIRIQLNLSK